MVKQEFHAIQCAHCGLHQVQQVKKNPQFKCTVCRKQQKLRHEHFRGSAKQSREIVQRLNKALHEGSISFTPISEESARELPMNSSEKRKLASDPESENSKRVRNTEFENRDTPAGASQVHRMSDDDEDLSPPKAAAVLPHSSKTISPSKTFSGVFIEKKTEAVSYGDDDDDDDIFGDIPSPRKNLHTETSPVEVHGSPPPVVPNSSTTHNHEQPLGFERPGKEPVAGIRSGKDELVDDDDEDDIFDDIPSPQNVGKESVSAHHDSNSSTAKTIPLRSSAKPFPQNEEVIEKKNISTGNGKSREISPEKGSEATDKDERVSIPPITAEVKTGKTSEEVGSFVSSDRRVSPAKEAGAEGATIVKEAWRRRSLSKLAKFKFDPDDELSEEVTVVSSTVPKILPVAPMPPADEPSSKKNSAPEDNDFGRTRHGATKKSLKATKHDETSSSPGGGRDRLLATLQRFKRVPGAKQSL